MKARKIKPLDEIRREGLDALRKRLGVAGTIRFMMQFEKGKGNYSLERRKWVEGTSMSKLKSILAADRRRIRKAG